MSLTSLLKLKSSQDLRKMILDLNLKPQLMDVNGKILKTLDWKTAILVPSIGKPYEAGTIGTAFDYIARFILTKIVGVKNATVRPLVAENAAMDLQYELLNQDQALMYEKDVSIKEERARGYELAQKFENELTKYIKKRLNSTKQAIRQFIANKIPIEEIVPHAIFLARLDAIFRAGSVVVVDEFLKHKFGKSYFSQKLTVTDEELANNVIQLAEVFEKHIKDVPMSHVSLNPVFVPYSCAVGGADADFIYDSTLIDIKTTNKFSYRTIDWAQVLGYVSMALATGIKIKQAGIYFARYGKSVIFNISLDKKKILADYLKNLLEAALKHDLFKCPLVEKPSRVEMEFFEKLRKEECIHCI